MKITPILNMPLVSSDVVFFTPSDFIGDEIAEITGGEFCHVAIYFEDDAGGGYFVECQGGTPKRITPVGFYAGRSGVIIFSGVSWADLQKKATEGVGVSGYDYIEAGIAGLSDLIKSQTGWSLETHASGNICSTFVAQLLGISYNAISPNDLFNLMREKPRLFRSGMDSAAAIAAFGIS